MRKTIPAVLAALAVLLLCSCGKTSEPAEAVYQDPVPADSELTADVVYTPDTSSPDVQVEDNSSDSASAVFSPAFTFETTDRSGNVYNENIFAGHKLTILNFWEPWCGPCVGEMPDLQKLYTNYSGKGLNIIGVYATQGMEEDVDSVLRSAGVTFTILRYTGVFDAFQTGYVPTTILVDGSGQVVGETIIGSQSYEEWEALIAEFLA